MLMSGFMSGSGAGPKKRWDKPLSYPALYGITKLRNVTFDSFKVACGGKRDVAIMTNPVVGDIMHPITLEEIKKYNMDEESTVFYTVPDPDL